MDYFKYIFSDKKAATYWIIYYSFLALLLLFGFVIKNYGEQNNEQTDIISVVFWIIIIFILLFAFILFYSFSFINYRLQQTFLTKYSNIIPKESIRQIKVVLNQSSYLLPAFKTNFYAKINPNAKNDIFIAFMINDNIGILGHKYDLGVFRWHLRPIIIQLTDKPILDKYKFAKIPKALGINQMSNDLEINFIRSLFGIKKLILIDWNK